MAWIPIEQAACFSLLYENMNFKEVIIKKATMDDLEEILSIEAFTSPNPWSKKMFIEEISNPSAHLFIIKYKRNLKNHPILGFICFRNIRGESELLNLCVHPQYRQLGIAKCLMQFYNGFCEKREIRVFHLEVHSVNHPAIHLYRSFSYQQVGIRRKFYRGRFDAFLMRKEI